MTTPAHQLATLLELGFARRDLAKIASTSVQSISLIARGDRPATRIDMYRLSQIDQLHRLVTQVFNRNAWGPMRTPAAWFGAQIVPGCPYTPMDLYVDGKLALVLEYAADLRTAEATLTEYDREWRKFTNGEWETVVGADGGIEMRRKGDA